VDLGDEPLGLVGIRVEVVADPFGEFGVTLMLGVVEDFEKFTIAPRPAAVLGRTAPSDHGQARVENARLGIDEALDELWAEVGDGKGGKAAYRGVFEAPTSPPKE
jgi:hypothetical protein